MKKVTFYDVETTGLPVWKKPSEDPCQPHIVQISAIQCDFDTQEIIQRIDLIVKPEGWIIPEEVVRIHGITTEKAIEAGVAEGTVVSLLLSLCKDSTRVAHNKTFDQRVVRIALKRMRNQFTEKGIEEWAKKDDHLCTMQLSKPIMRLEPKGRFGYKSPKLEEAYRFFTGKTLGDNAHSSIFDTAACMKVYFAIKRGEHVNQNN